MDINEKYKIAVKLLQIDLETIIENSGEIEDLSALYVSIPEKGGPSLIVGDDGSVLYADSSVGYTRHVEAFRSGTRTPIESFGIGE